MVHGRVSVSALRDGTMASLLACAVLVLVVGGCGGPNMTPKANAPTGAAVPEKKTQTALYKPVTAAGFLTRDLEALPGWAIIASVEEKDIAKVALGQEVRIAVEAMRGRSFKGNVVKVGAAYMTRNIAYFTVTVQVLEPDPKFKEDMPTNVEFVPSKPAEPPTARPTSAQPPRH